MNQSLDSGIYSGRTDLLGTDLINQRRVLHTRILKLSLNEDDQPYMELGEELFDSAQFQKSIFPFKRAAIIKPENSYAQVMLAKAFFKLDKENEAYCSIKKALSLCPRDSQVHQFLIETLEEKHRLQNLESFSKEIVNMIADPIEIPFFYFGSAEALVRYNKYPQALVSYRKAVESNSSDYYHYYNYGLALYREGLFEEAIVQFERVKSLDPSVKLAWNNVAHLYYCLGRVQKAREEFEYIIANGLEVHVIYSNFLLVLHHLDQDEEVINKYKDLFQPYVISHHYVLPKLYKEELRITEAILQRDEIDEKTREFNAKKLKGINFVLSFLN